MSYTNRWLLPEGIEEVLPPQAMRLERLRRRVIDLFYAWGYDLVIPPLIEYLESLLTGLGNDLDLQTFKLIDQLTGRLMGVRADMTPQVTRIEAHHLKREVPVRLCYLGPVLHSRPGGLRRSRSPLQVGAELYGHGGTESDLEVLRLMVQTLATTGIHSPYIDVGHVGIFRALARQADLDDAREATLFDALQRKAKPEIGALLSELSLAPRVHEMLLALVDLNGGEEVLAQARGRLHDAGPAVHEALAALERIARDAAQDLGRTALHFDLAELRGYAYHTGIVFAAYLPGHGQAVAQGGRYDGVGAVFGHPRPATGFSADLKTLVALSPTEAEVENGIFAPCSPDPGLRQEIEALRGRGERVVCALPGQTGGPRELGCQRLLAQRDGQWRVVSLN